MLDAMRVFLDIVDTGSLSKAAKRHNLAVSSISRKLDALEAELGFKLFHRTSRVITLTDAGEQFLPGAKNIILEFDQARHSVCELNREPQGLLTITAPVSFGRLHIGPAVTSFLKRYPRMNVELHISDQIIDLSNQRADIAIRISKLPDSDLVATHLAPFHRVICASPSYLQTNGQPKTYEDLLQHNCLTTLPGQGLPGIWTFEGVNGGDPLPIRGNYRSNDTNCLRDAAVDGVGITHLASWLVSDLIASGKLTLIAFNATEINRHSTPAIQAVRLPGRSHSKRSQLFIAHLRELFGEPAYWDRALFEHGLELNVVK